MKILTKHSIVYKATMVISRPFRTSKASPPDASLASKVRTTKCVHIVKARMYSVGWLYTILNNFVR